MHPQMRLMQGDINCLTDRYWCFCFAYEYYSMPVEIVQVIDFFFLLPLMSKYISMPSTRARARGICLRFCFYSRAVQVLGEHCKSTVPRRFKQEKLVKHLSQIESCSFCLGVYLFSNCPFMTFAGAYQVFNPLMPGP